MVSSEVQSLLTSPPALAHEWSILHRTFCAKQPESMWNLLGMVFDCFEEFKEINKFPRFG